MIHGSNDLRAPDVVWVLRGRLALPSPSAALVAGPAPPPSCMPASRLPAHASLRVHVRTVPAELRPRHSRLCYSFALRRFSLPLHYRALLFLRV